MRLLDSGCLRSGSLYPAGGETSVSYPYRNLQPGEVSRISIRSDERCTTAVKNPGPRRI